MSAIVAYWKRAQQAYLGLSRRERALVALALVLGPLLIANALMLEPLQKQIRAQENTLSSETTSLLALQSEVASLQKMQAADPDAGNKAEVSKLQAEQLELDARLKQIGSGLVPPEQMNALLEGLLARQPGLQLVSLRTIPPQGALDVADEPAKTAAKPSEEGGVQAHHFNLYRHGVELRMSGSFSQLQAYLAALEKLPQSLIWGRLDYRVLSYPTAEMSLTLYTLSPDKAWLSL